MLITYDSIKGVRVVIHAINSIESDELSNYGGVNPTILNILYYKTQTRTHT